MPVAVVFDTNVLFSASGWRGNPFRCVELARQGLIHAITCEFILSELAEKLAGRLGISAPHVDQILAGYLSFHQVVQIAGTLDAVPRDPEDNAVLECALAGNARFVITGDKDLLSIRQLQQIEIVSAREFLRRWNASEIPRV